MGFYIHDVWQIAHGEWTSSVFGFHVFADHFSPIMILLGPVALVDTGYGLLVIQAIVVGTAVVPAYRIGRNLRDERLGWLCAVWFAFSASVWHTVMYDFRPATLGAVALIWLIAEVEGNQRTWVVWMLTLLATSAREDVAVFTGVALLIHAVGRRDRQLFLPAIFALAVGLWYTTVGHRLFAPFEYFLWYRYADYADSPLGVVANLGYAVPTALGRLTRPEVLIAFGAILVPVLIILPILGWRRAWPGFVIMVGNGVSGAPFIPTIYYQYYILAVVFVIWGSAHALAARDHWLRAHRPMIYLAVVVFLLAGPVMAHQQTPYGRSVVDVVSAADRAAFADDIEAIPADESVSAGNSFLPHLAERARVYSFPLPLVCGEVIQRYTPKTQYPKWVVIRPEERGVIDLEQLGYEVVDNTPYVSIWASSGEHPASRECRSSELLRTAAFERVRAHVGEG